MATYKARPLYEVKVGKRTVVFDYFGSFETEDASVIAALDGLVPAYIQRIDEPEPVAPDEPEQSVAPKAEPPKASETKTEDKPKARKSSAK